MILNNNNIFIIVILLFCSQHNIINLNHNINDYINSELSNIKIIDFVHSNVNSNLKYKILKCILENITGENYNQLLKFAFSFNNFSNKNILTFNDFDTFSNILNFKSLKLLKNIFNSTNQIVVKRNISNYDISQKKIAFLFLTLDNPNYPNIWNEYFKNHHHLINIYIHPKFPNNLSWNTHNMIINLKDTAWGFIVNAYISLFEEAYQNKTNVKFVTISESCLPIKPFMNFYNDALTDINESWIKLMKISKYDYISRLTQQIKKKYKKNCIKHYARMCLSRKHVKLLLNNKYDVNKYFGSMHVGDEFFLSSIYPLNNIRNFAVTHDDWEYVEKLKKNIKNEIWKEKDKKMPDTNKINELQEKYNFIAKNPKTIYSIDSEDLNNIMSTKSYFYRKFDKNISNIESVILPLINS